MDLRLYPKGPNSEFFLRGGLGLFLQHAGLSQKNIKRYPTECEGKFFEVEGATDYSARKLAAWYRTEEIH